MIFPKTSFAWARPERVRHIDVTGGVPASPPHARALYPR